MTARELVDSLAVLDGVRHLRPDTQGISASALVNGIEIASARPRQSNGDLRAAWRPSDTSGGPTPLLAASRTIRSAPLGARSRDRPSDCTTGPCGSFPPMRSADVLRRASTLCRRSPGCHATSPSSSSISTPDWGRWTDGQGPRYRAPLPRALAANGGLAAHSPTLPLRSHESWRDALHGVRLRPRGSYRAAILRAAHGPAPVAVVHPGSRRFGLREARLGRAAARGHPARGAAAE